MPPLDYAWTKMTCQAGTPPPRKRSSSGERHQREAPAAAQAHPLQTPRARSAGDADGAATDLFDYLTYEEWKEGMDKCPALYWNPYLAVQQLMGRAYTPIRWR
jgi:hypothetical protein